jgi:ABC-type transporter Mla subunit MlaD
MEIRLVIFLAFVCVTVVTNTVMIFFAYKALTGVASKMTKTMSEFTTSSETRQWLESIQAAAEQAAALTEATKVRIAEAEPALSRAQESHRRILETVDSKLEKAAGDINAAAQKVRDVVAKPAFAVVSFSAGIRKLMDDR